MRILTKILFVFAAVVVFIAPARVVYGTSQEELQNQIEEYTNQLSKLSAQSNTLSNQIAQFDTQIKLTELKVADTEEKIKLLGGRIDTLDDSLKSLEDAFSERVVETYKMARLGDSTVMVLTSGDLSQAVSRYNYLQRVQIADRDLLSRLQSAQDAYKEQKTSQEELQAQLEKQKVSLAAQKSAKNSLLSATKNDEKKYQQLLSQAKAELASFSSFASSQGGASLLSGQTKCNDGWTGCYYNQRDSGWGNITLGGTSYQMKDSGCFVTSVAMMASHNGKDIKPGDIAAIPAVFTSQGDLKWQPFDVKGVNISISSASVSNLDSLLASGPVIAKLSFSTNPPQNHFIVILRKEGGNYIMNDPFLENGGNRPLTDKYSVDNISSLRLVQFN